jgi:glycosyltransferase involved in cell wall biosynthesis
LHIAIVDEELPYPPNTGKRLRTFKLLSRLAHRHRLTYICHRNADRDEAQAAARVFRDHLIEPVMVDRTVPPKSGAGFYFRLAANLLSPLPYSVATHRSAALEQAVHAYAAAHPVDLWHCEWTPYAEALRGLRNVRRLVTAHNVESLIWQRYYETEPQALKRWYIGKQWQKFERFERRAFAEADQIVAVSPEDAALIKRQFGAAHVAVVDNGVDTEYFRPPPGRREPARILFLGSLDWRPNLDALDQLLDHIFPTVQAVESTARLCLVGRNPPAALRDRVNHEPGVELHANVADVRPFLARSGVLAVPLRIGGGSRLKILEALAAGVPVVSTRVGAEGLCLEADKHLTVVEGIGDMAAALVRTIRAPEQALALAACGRQRVLECYDWGLLADKLEKVWIACVTAAREAGEEALAPLPPRGERGCGEGG